MTGQVSGVNSRGSTTKSLALSVWKSVVLRGLVVKLSFTVEEMPHAEEEGVPQKVRQGKEGWDIGLELEETVEASEGFFRI